MFILERELTATVIFQFEELERLGYGEEILRRLREKVEHRCVHEFGYIVQVVMMDHEVKALASKNACVMRNHCQLDIEFSAICFKAQKKDIIDMVVEEINDGFLKGKVGHAEVMIPASKMTEFVEFRKDENVYWIRETACRIDLGSKVRCQVLEVKIDMGYQMKIIAVLNKRLLPYIIT